MALNVLMPECYDYFPWIDYNNKTKTWFGFFPDFMIELEKKTKLKYVEVCIFSNIFYMLFQNESLCSW